MHPLTRTIADLQRSLNLRGYATAACRMAAVVLGAALLLGLLDFAVRFTDPGLRIMMTATLVAAATWAAHRWWYLPTRRPWTPLQVAHRVEKQFPSLGDSLSSALEFLRQPEDDAAAGSAQLRRHVIVETETGLENLPLDAVIDHRPLRRALAWLAVPLIAIGIFLTLDARAVSTALARLAAPLGTTQWPRQHHLVFRDPPTRLAAGQAFEAELIDTAGPLPDQVRFEYRGTENGRREFSSEPMVRVGESMLARRENVRRPFAFRAVGGDDDTMRWHSVEVVEPPQLESLNITVHPPAYTALPARSAERHLRVLAGSRIEMHGTVDRPIRTARILLESDMPINATVRSGAAGNPQQSFHVDPSEWAAVSGGPYRLEVTQGDDAAAVVARGNLRVEPDPAPSISWQFPVNDLFVLPSAVVPIDLLVKDNLAIQRVDLVYSRPVDSETGGDRRPTEPRIELYRGPEKPAVAHGEPVAAPEDYRVVEYLWDLTSLDLPAGAELILNAEAADYRPGIGRTISPRRIRIFTPEQLETRLADRQSQIVRQLERALALEKTTRDEVRQLESQEREAGLTAEDRHALQSAELNQQRVGRMLVDPVNGILPLADSLYREIEINRIDGSDLHSLLARLTSELNRLSAASLQVAERELTAARKTLHIVELEQGVAVSDSLSAAGTAQDDVIATLEQLVEELSGKADYQRVVQLLAELRKDQLALQKTALQEIGIKTLPLRLSELTRAQQATLNRAANSQTALAARFEKIEQGMDRLSQDSVEEQSESAATLASAVELARRLAVVTKMNDSARHLRQNRIGQALARKTVIASDLQQILDVLLQRQQRNPQQTAENLRSAEHRLAELRKRLAALRQQIRQAEQVSGAPADPQQREPARREQQKLRQEIEQLTGQLKRLQAEAASQSAQSAADRLDDRDQANAKRLASSEQVQQAERDLEQAAEQLAQRRQQAEDDLALELVRRFQSQLGEMVERQQRVIKRTAELEMKREPSKPPASHWSQELNEVTQAERQLADKAREHGELLYGLGAVRLSLEDAERRLLAAAKLLEQQQTGPAAQDAERRALNRLKGIQEAFAQTAADAGQNRAEAADGAAGGQQPQRRPTFELLEVKMIRMLQAELNERTATHRQGIRELADPLNDGQRAELDREARELAAEQGRLAELVETMLARDNEVKEQ